MPKPSSPTLCGFLILLLVLPLQAQICQQGGSDLLQSGRDCLI